MNALHNATLLHEQATCLHSPSELVEREEAQMMPMLKGDYKQKQV
jgi:hypothetical protein